MGAKWLFGWKVFTTVDQLIIDFFIVLFYEIIKPIKLLNINMNKYFLLYFNERETYWFYGTKTNLKDLFSILTLSYCYNVYWRCYLISVSPWKKWKIMNLKLKAEQTQSNMKMKREKRVLFQMERRLQKGWVMRIWCFLFRAGFLIYTVRAREIS